MIDRIPGCRFIIGIAYVMAIMLARKLAVSQRPKGRIVEYPDELGLWWEPYDD